MQWKLIRLRGASVGENGELTNRRGEAIGMRVTPDGYLIFDDGDQIVGTLTLAGRVYDRNGHLVTQVDRHDLDLLDRANELACEIGGALEV